MNPLKSMVVEALENLKAENIQVLDVKNITLITDYMIVATGNSNRHTQAIASNLLDEIKKKNPTSPIVVGVEGEKDGEWILLDLGDVVVHVMLARVRDFYRLEKLWADTENHQDTDEPLAAVS